MFDGSNIIYKTFHANAGEDANTAAGMANHVALTTLNKYYKLYKPDQVVVAFDRSNWRKEYTKSEQCVSGKLYKGNRRQEQTPKEKERYLEFCEHIKEFESLLETQTAIITLAADGLEADDLIAGVCEKYWETHDITIISADKDMMQLLKFPSVILVDPATGKQRTLVEYQMDAKLFMFIKCIRGDAGDNVQSAFPRVRMTRIMEAYNDPYVFTNMMKETWTDQTGKVMLVEQLFNENKVLMDLTAQPESIRKLMFDTIDHSFANPGEFNMFYFLRFCGKFGLKRIADGVEQYVKLLA